MINERGEGMSAQMAVFENHRIEHKFYISWAEAMALRERLSPILQKDPHSDARGRYLITSIYFDTPLHRSLRGAEAGLEKRKKIRIRTYNHDPSYIRIEYKERHGRLSRKRGLRITEEECRSILAGDPTPLLAHVEDTLHPTGKSETALGLYHDLAHEGYRPSTFVEYEREIYTHPISRVRITLDTHMQGGAANGEIFPTAPLQSIFPEDMVLLEVKYSHFLPAFIGDLLPVNVTNAITNSKFLRASALS
jgi:hypothetical protein